MKTKDTKDTKAVEPEFIDRINNPQNYPFIANDDGSYSTHRMAAEVDEEGNWYVFPTIVNINGGLHEFHSPQEAMKFNMRTGNYLPMKDQKQALDYAKGSYKKGTARETYNPYE